MCLPTQPSSASRRVARVVGLPACCPGMTLELVDTHKCVRQCTAHVLLCCAWLLMSGESVHNVHALCALHMTDELRRNICCSSGARCAHMGAPPTYAKGVTRCARVCGRTCSAEHRQMVYIYTAVYICMLMSELTTFCRPMEARCTCGAFAWQPSQPASSRVELRGEACSTPTTRPSHPTDGVIGCTCGRACAPCSASTARHCEPWPRARLTPVQRPGLQQDAWTSSPQRYVLSSLRAACRRRSSSLCTPASCRTAASCGLACAGAAGVRTPSYSVLPLRGAKL